MDLVAPRHVGSSQTRAQTRVPCIGRQILNCCTTREVPALFLKCSISQFSLGYRNLSQSKFSLKEIYGKRSWGREAGTGQRSHGHQQPQQETPVLRGLSPLLSSLFDFILCCAKFLMTGASPLTAAH